MYTYLIKIFILTNKKMCNSYLLLLTIDIQSYMLTLIKIASLKCKI